MSTTFLPQLLSSTQSAVAVVLIAVAIGASAPTAAHAALGEPAGTAWTPLGADEYFHTFSTSFKPAIPPAAGDSKTDIRRMYVHAAPTGEETWLARDGRGTTIDIQGGGGDPEKFPQLFPDKNWVTHAYSGTTSAFMPASLFPAGLRYADAVSTAVSPDPSKTVYTTHYRAPGAFKTGNVTTSFTRPDDGHTRTEEAQIATWGATIAALDAANAAPAGELDAAVAKLIRTDEHPARTQAPAIGRYGITRATAAEERRIARVVELLGAAPLAQPTRAALFAWLAKRPTATIVTGAADSRGRAGTRLTFQTIRNVPVKARTVTLVQLLKSAGFKASAAAKVKNGKPSYVVPAHHEYRRWYVDLVFDPTSNELLQQVLHERAETDVMLPSIRSFGVNGLRVGWAKDRRGASDARVHEARERTTAIAPQAQVCVDSPDACR